MTEKPTPVILAKLIIVQQNGENFITHSCPFYTLEEARTVAQTITKISPSIGWFGWFSFDYVGGTLSIRDPATILCVTLHSRKVEDETRLADAPYEKWMEERVEEIIKGGTGFGIGRN